MTQTSSYSAKIKDLPDLGQVLASVRADGKKIVHCHGVFDLIHIGHIRHFEEAKKFGDLLVVTITRDEFVNKGPGRPVFNQDLRLEAIAALDCVDYVAVNEWPLASGSIEIIRPDFYVKGSDYRNADDDRTGGIALEEESVKAVGGALVFTDDITFSSSSLINRNLPVFSKETSEFLAKFGSQHSSREVIDYLDQAQLLKVLVIGETIIDEYVYCETLGKSGKEPVLAARHRDDEKFAGGIISVANYVSALSDNVGLVTFLGKANPQEQFITDSLDPKIAKSFLYMDDDAPTIVKRRFVEHYPLQKLFEIYEISERDCNVTEAKALRSKLIEELPRYDVVIVTDYGHGMLLPEEIDLLCNEARFLAVNTQVNAGNRGFNTVSKYPRADFICVSENEIRLEMRDRRTDLKDIVQTMSERLSCNHMLITRGEQGCLCYSKEEGFCEVPAFALHVVDRVGAGDTLFALSSLCVALGAPMDVVGFVGNAAGAQAVASLGSQSSINRLSLTRHVESLLK